jgi:putative effector of murein hydrolase
LLLISEAGRVFVGALQLPLPGNLVGMLMSFALLTCGVIRLEWVEAGASMLVRHLGFFFIPIAIELVPVINGNPTLTAVCVIATGMIGAMLGPLLMKIVGIYDPLARGLAHGTISHGQGIARAVIEGELQGAAAGIAMSLAAVFTSCIAPFLVPFLV